jgi:hypothetical protein
MFRRLRRIEAQLAPKHDVADLRAAELLRERRRGRLEASGETLQEQSTPIVSSGPSLSVAETLRRGRQLRAGRTVE